MLVGTAVSRQDEDLLPCSAVLKRISEGLAVGRCMWPAVAAADPDARRFACRYRHTSYHRQTKDHWARDDPAFVVILAGLVALITAAYCLACVGSRAVLLCFSLRDCIGVWRSGVCWRRRGMYTVGRDFLAGGRGCAPIRLPCARRPCPAPPFPAKQVPERLRPRASLPARFGPGFWKSLGIIALALARDFLLVGGAISLVGWLLATRLLWSPRAGDHHAVEQRMELMYAYDVHCNALLHWLAIVDGAAGSRRARGPRRVVWGGAPLGAGGRWGGGDGLQLQA